MTIRFLAVTAALLLLAACHRGAEPGAISYDGHVVRAQGWTKAAPADWTRVLTITASDAADAPPLAGDYELKGSTIEFTPRFAPSPALSLHVTYHQADGTISTALFPGKAGYVAPSVTKVAQIYPTTGEWPANTLKVYIQFSGPMKQGVAWSHIRLLDETGQAIKQPFVEIDQELWNPSDTRLTVLFDPGRIKRGLLDNEAEGPPLVAGHRYTLTIDKDWPDAAGAPLAEGFQRSFTAGADVRVPVRTEDWKVTAPTPNQALVITFPRPMDNALVRTAITVTKDGQKIPGRVILEVHETRWVFIPDHKWAPGDYQLHVEGTASGIADVAGNLLGRLFDVDMTDPKQEGPEPPASADIPFRVG